MVFRLTIFPPDTPEFVLDMVPELVEIAGPETRVVVSSNCNQNNFTCNQATFSNTLSWPLDAIDVDYYELYYSRTGLKRDYELVARPTSKSFRYAGLQEFKGCYRVKAFDLSGNESGLSQT